MNNFDLLHTSTVYHVYVKNRYTPEKEKICKMLFHQVHRVHCGHPPSPNVIVYFFFFKGLAAQCHSFCLFVFITYSTDIHSITFIQFTYPSPLAGASLHCLFSAFSPQMFYRQVLPTLLSDFSADWRKSCVVQILISKSTIGTAHK